MPTKLLGATSRIETPFISVQIGDYTFGVFNKSVTSESYVTYQRELYPNFVHSLNIVKVNGAVNTYTLGLKYQIRPGDDPNFLEKVFSKQATTRRMILSYGDYSMPSFIYKQEACTITDVKSSIDFNSSAISYTITAISDALSLKAGTHNFPKRVAKPSDVIKEILYDKGYGVQDIFYGMRDPDLVTSKGMIASDDKEISIDAKNGVTIFDYLNYLVSCMSPSSSLGSSVIQSGRYTFVIYDDYQGEVGGPYFKVQRITTNSNLYNKLDTYVIDIGYPGVDPVMDFSVDDDQTYSILYNYSEEINQSQYVYRINNSGEVDQIYSPTISNNTTNYKTSEADKIWWTSVTQYPIKATLTIKGLLRAAVLMSYVRINVYFYGQKHLSSGLYLITKQQDSINESGYRTILSLTRISGDDQ